MRIGLGWVDRMLTEVGWTCQAPG